MKTVILAAGKGTRLYPLTSKKPKALLSICGKPLILHQIDLLKSFGFHPDDIIVVGGYKGEILSKILPQNVIFILNENYSVTNNIYSLYLVKPHIDDTLYIVNGDVFFHPSVFRKLFEDPFPNIAVIDMKKPVRKEAMKVIIDNGFIHSFGKHLKKQVASGEYIGISKLKEEGLYRLFEILENKVKRGEVVEWYESAFDILVKEISMKALYTNSGLWIDIDLPDDFERVKRICNNFIMR